MVQASSPDLALCHVSTEQCGVRMLCSTSLNATPPRAKQVVHIIPARTAPVPVSKTGLDQVHGGKGRGLLVQLVWRHLRRKSSRSLCSVPRRSCKGRAALRRTRLFCMLRAHESGRRFDQAWRGSGTMHGMLGNREVRERPTLERSSPNNRMERGVNDKVHCRGRVSSVLGQVTSARVREALACARSCERWASVPRT
jgi:hypothetical protein